MEVSTNRNPRMCRICMDKDEKANLLAPCHCRGSIKYVHPQCLALWRQSLAESGHKDESYRCTLCLRRFQICHRSWWAALVSNPVIRCMMSAFILALVLVPAGLCMKIALHLCAQQPPHVAMDNEYPGDDDDDASLQAAHLLSRILPSTLRDTMQNWFWFPHQYSSNTTIRKVIYAPFPVCWMSSATNVFHSISIESLLYNFTNSGRQLWQLFLCRLEHFHLGLFLIGGLWTLRLVFTTLNSVLTTHQRHLHAHPWLLAGNDHEGEDEDEEEVNIEHHENELMRAAVALQAAAEHSDVIDRIVETLGKLVKSFVLLYCCWIVVLVWIHFFVFAFYVDPINQGYTMPAVDMGLWVFRWIITTFAVIDCVKKCIYDQIGCSINEEQVISLHHSR